MKITPRKFVGAAILAVTILVVAFGSVVTTMLAGKTYTVEFVRGEQMNDDSSTILAEAASTLKGNPSFNAKINGYTGVDGDQDANVELSTKRAEAVRDALINNGIDASRLVASGLGSSKPLSKQDGESDAAWGRRNSRVEIILGK